MQSLNIGNNATGGEEQVLQINRASKSRVGWGEAGWGTSNRFFHLKKSLALIRSKSIDSISGTGSFPECDRIQFRSKKDFKNK